MSAFTLDPRLAADAAPVMDLPLSSVRLADDARFPWLILIPRRPDAFDLIDLSMEDGDLLTKEIRAVCLAVRREVQSSKLNVANLGNQVRQLHIHIIGRSVDDAAWPNPVWNCGARRAYDPVRLTAEAERWRAAITRELESVGLAR